MAGQPLPPPRAPWLGQGPRAAGSLATNTYLLVPASPADTVQGGIAAAGVDQGSATVLSANFSEVVSVGLGTGVILPPFMGTPGYRCRVASYGAEQLLVYPLPGQTFYSGGVSNGLNIPLTVQIGIVAEFECLSSATVYTVP